MHIIFDWNGTLLNDVGLVIECDNRIGTERGYWKPIDLTFYRRNSSRNWRDYYETLAGHPFSDEEISSIDIRWHEIYEEISENAKLFEDVRPTLEMLQQKNIEMSVHSMHPHEQLLVRVADFGLTGYFADIQGLRVQDSGQLSKRHHLSEHVASIQTKSITFIGDNIDDGESALAIGINCVLVTTGEHGTEQLEKLGVPVAPTLSQAVDLIVGDSQN